MDSVLNSQFGKQDGTGNLSEASSPLSQWLAPLAKLDYFFPGASLLIQPTLSVLGLAGQKQLPIALILVTLIGIVGYIQTYLWEFIQSYFACSIRIRADDDVYNMVVLWLSKQNFTRSSRHLVVNTDIKSRSWHLQQRNETSGHYNVDISEDSPSGLISAQNQLRFTPAPGVHLFWYKGQPLLFDRRVTQRYGSTGTATSSDEEELVFFCFGRQTAILYTLVGDIRQQYLENDHDKVAVFRPVKRYSDAVWERCKSKPNRPLSSIALDERIKTKMLNDLAEYIQPETQLWYANRGIPYRRGYLFHGPPGTGKSSLSLALAGHFQLRIYIINFSSPTINEDTLAALFADLPTHCIVLLEDIDAAGVSNRQSTTGGTEESGTTSGGAGESSAVKSTADSGEKDSKEDSESSQTRGRVSLSGLLNVLDGVASQEGRVVIMTTNHPESLDHALTRPGRVDISVPFTSCTKDMAISIFKSIYTSFENESRGNTKEKSKIDSLETLAVEFASKIPSDKLSPAQIQGLLLQHKHDPIEAVEATSSWVEDELQKGDKEQEVEGQGQ